MNRFRKIYSLIFALCLMSFTAYALLDTFVITRVYATVESPAAETIKESAETEQSILSAEIKARNETELQSDNSAKTLSVKRGGSRGHGKKAGSAGNSDKTSEKLSTAPANSSTAESASEVSSGESGDAQVSITEYRVDDTTVYVADIRLTSASQLKTAFSQNCYGRNVTADTSDTAETAGALLAINGDNYGSREKGYVIRNGVLYRDKAAKDQEDLVIYADGSFEIIREDEITAQELLEAGAMQVFSFGPGLVENGELTVSSSEEVDRAKASNPRTAIGIIEEGHYVFVVSDGRTDASEGLTLYQLAEFMQSLGVRTAYNLDGGGSSTMVYSGEVVNQPTSGHGIDERAVTDIIFIEGD